MKIKNFVLGDFYTNILHFYTFLYISLGLSLTSISLCCLMRLVMGILKAPFYELVERRLL